MILDVFEKAFKKGCGISLEQAVQSERYAELRQNQQTLLERYSAGVDKGVALRAGHLAMGKLFNIFPEEEAIEQAKNLPVIERGIEHRALIQLLGEHIIAEAGKCLPKKALEMAEEWKQVDVERQIEIARDLYFFFGSDSQRQEKKMNWQVMREEIDDDLRYNYSGGAERFLPRLYGKWDKKNCPADCQGKTQMLVAFARLAKVSVLVVAPIIHASDVREEWRIKVCQEIEEDILRRDIEPDAQMWESLRAQRQLDWIKKFRMPNFHSAAALRLRDGNWVLIDPHGLDWGVFPDAWRINDIWRMLCKYQEALPGLSLIGHDHGLSETLKKQELRKAEDLIERSRILEAKIGDNPIFDAINILTESPDLELILRDLCELKLEELTDNKDLGKDLRRYFALMLVTGEEFPSFGSMFQLTTDKELIRKKIGSLLTSYHCIAMNGLKDQLNEIGKLIHPVCEFSLPDYHIAMAVINSLNCNTGIIGQEFFLDYEFNQLVLGNSMTEIFTGNKQNIEFAQRAARTLLALPFIHGRCQQVLRLANNLI